MARSLKLDLKPDPAATGSATTPLSPQKEASPFRFPDILQVWSITQLYSVSLGPLKTRFGLRISRFDT